MKYQQLSPLRKIAADCLYALLLDYRGQILSEEELCSRWLSKVRKLGHTFDSGWYTPPPNGYAALVACEDDLDRISFDSLRSQNYWPCSRNVDWNSGLLYVYCSPVDRMTGEIGDFTAFHYFGQNKQILRHIAECKAVHRDILDCIQTTMTSKELHEVAASILDGHNLYIEGYSATDPGRVNLGHTFTRLSQDRLSDGASQLDADDIAQLSQSRRFINQIDSWSLMEAKCFTVEPRLRSKLKVLRGLSCD